jgi:TRAP-type mannitol/chloroaromatic compound transport system substrate-binding protein
VRWGAPVQFATRLAKWHEPPKLCQSAFMAASHETWGWVLGRYDSGNPPALRRLVGGGAQVRAFPPEVLESCYKAANEVYAEHSATNSLFKKLYDSVVPFRSESSIWMQIAELSYDSFIIRMRART